MSNWLYLFLYNRENIIILEDRNRIVRVGREVELVTVDYKCDRDPLFVKTKDGLSSFPCVSNFL